MAGSLALGRKIHELREAKKQVDPRFSQRGFAALLSLSPTFLNKVESGELTPSAETIKAMAKELETDPDELLALAEKVDPKLNDIILENPKVMAAFLRTASGMSAPQLERFQRYMELDKQNQENISESDKGKQ